MYSYLSVQNQERTRLLLFKIGEATSPSGCSRWREHVLRGERWAWWWMAAGTYFDSGNRWMMMQNMVLKPRARRYTRQTGFISVERRSHNWATLVPWSRSQTDRLVNSLGRWWILGHASREGKEGHVKKPVRIQTDWYAGSVVITYSVGFTLLWLHFPGFPSLCGSRPRVATQAFSVIWMAGVKQQPSFATDLLAHLTHGLLSSLSSPSASPSPGLGTWTSQTSGSSFSYWSSELDAGRDRQISLRF